MSKYRVLIIIAVLALAAVFVSKNNNSLSGINRPGQINGITTLGVPARTDVKAEVLFGANIVGDKIVIAQIKDTGISVTTYWLYLPLFLDPQGNVKVNQVQQAIKEYSAQRGGLEVLVHIMPQTQEQARASLGFFAPNLNQFKKQVAQLAQALKGQVRHYSIANEVPSTWSDTVENYGKMLSTAHAAIKSVDKTAIVLDSGVSSLTYVGLVAKEIRVSKGDRAAMEFINGYTKLHSAKPLNQFLPVNTPDKLDSILNSKENKEALDYIDMVFKSHCDQFDAYQLHFYQEWPYLEKVLDWIKTTMNKTKCIKPIQIWELGYGVDNIQKYDRGAHAENVKESLTIAVNQGVKLINYVTFYEKSGLARGLFEPNGEPKPAAAAFKETIFNFLNK